MIRWAAPTSPPYADYAMRLMEQMKHINEHSFNNFQMKIGKKAWMMARFPRDVSGVKLRAAG